MKKKILLCLLVMVGVLIITGCGKTGESNINTKQEVSKEKILGALIITVAVMLSGIKKK